MYKLSGILFYMNPMASGLSKRCRMVSRAMPHGSSFSHYMLSRVVPGWSIVWKMSCDFIGSQISHAKSHIDPHGARFKTWYGISHAASLDRFRRVFYGSRRQSHTTPHGHSHGTHSGSISISVELDSGLGTGPRWMHPRRYPVGPPCRRPVTIAIWLQ